jgi:hypothetical protein
VGQVDLAHHDHPDRDEDGLRGASGWLPAICQGSYAWTQSAMAIQGKLSEGPLMLAA